MLHVYVQLIWRSDTFCTMDVDETNIK